MFDKWVELHVKLSKKTNSTAYKLRSIIIAVIIFLIVVPTLLIWLGLQLEGIFSFPLKINRHIEVISSVIVLPVGLFFYIWANIAQWKLGDGTIAISAPTQKIVIQGPYKLCRNPLELGSVLYYLGVSTLVASIFVGIFSSSVMFILGSAYHKFFEEKELEARFGQQYLEYKKHVPFIIPRFKPFVNRKNR